MTDTSSEVEVVAAPYKGPAPHRSTVKHVDVPPVSLDYATSLESTAVVNIADRYGLFIGGRMVEPRSGRYFTTINPATEEPIARVAEANAADVDDAVRAARRAYDKYWRDMPGKERAKYIYRIARVLQERAREFAVLETLDGGKSIKESRDVDIPLVARLRDPDDAIDDTDLRAEPIDDPGRLPGLDQRRDQRCLLRHDSHPKHE